MTSAALGDRWVRVTAACATEIEPFSGTDWSHHDDDDLHRRGERTAWRVCAAGRQNFLVVQASDVFGEPTTIKITPTNLAEFYATQANNLSSGIRTLAGFYGDWRPISELADLALDLVQASERRGDAACGQTGRADPAFLRSVPQEAGEHDERQAEPGKKDIPCCAW